MAERLTVSRDGKPIMILCWRLPLTAGGRGEKTGFGEQEICIVDGFPCGAPVTWRRCGRYCRLLRQGQRIYLSCG